ncbi:MAG: LPS export ABC transporter permease LptG [Gammaproteobacteria bacterium]
MILLRGYIVMSVLRGVGLALAVLVAVMTSFDLIAQLNDIKGSYDLSGAIVYVVLGIPRTVFSVLPAAALIGSLLALGNLAVHRELIVMRASGISSWQLLFSVGLAGFALSVLMVLLGESLAPSLSAYADEMRTRAMREDVGTAEGTATWFKDGDRIFSLRRQTGDSGYRGGVLLFELGPDQALRQIARADTASVDSAGRWVLSNYGETGFLENGVTSRTERQSTQTYDLNPDLLALSIVRENLLDTPSLQRYIRYLEDNGLDARRYLIAYWTRMADIVSVVLMTILALPFVFGGLRSAGTGARLLVGLVVGLSYYAIGQVLASGGEVYGIQPLVVAWAPSSVLFLITIVAVARAR